MDHENICGEIARDLTKWFSPEEHSSLRESHVFYILHIAYNNVACDGLFRDNFIARLFQNSLTTFVVPAGLHLNTHLYKFIHNSSVFIRGYFFICYYSCKPHARRSNLLVCFALFYLFRRWYF